MALTKKTVTDKIETVKSPKGDRLGASITYTAAS